jgi:glycosyltransferase involved in cell wall biosynthesis
MSTISFIIPSLNRRTLHRTIDRIKPLPGDEVLVEFDLPPTRMWGNPQRNKAIERASGDYLAFIDDDDYYVEGAREIMARAIAEHPGKALLFRMRYPNGKLLWETPDLVPGNVGSPMILCPNEPVFITPWKDGRNMADFIFINEWPRERIIWREEIIANLGHNDGEKTD